MYNSCAEEQMLMCKPLPAYSTDGHIFNQVDLYMAENGLGWKHCVNICTRSMVWRMCDFVSHVKAIAPERSSSHCIIHCEALDLKMIPNALTTMLGEVVKVVNRIKSDY
jgi:hypothetical protein